MDDVTGTSIDALPVEIVATPASPGYRAATAPDNSSFRQAPVAVARPRSAAEVAAAVVAARHSGLRIAVQATGHGAGHAIDDTTLLLDTTGLNEVRVDPDRRVAHVGAGATWDRVQSAAQEHGLLALAGTSPSVGVCGYTVHGGVGWLVRPFGLASASLAAVRYVDGRGTIHHDRDGDAVWAFRGGAPVGVATELEFGLVPVQQLWAGYLLWPAEQLPTVLPAWAAMARSAPETLTSTMSLLRLPPDGPFPDELRGRAVVHLSWACPTGEAGLAEARRAIRDAADPVVDTTGPADADELARIHLDPPAAVPARGTGLWLTGGDPDRVANVLDAAGIGGEDGLNMVEVRHVGSATSTAALTDGALTRVPGPFLLHAVGAAADDAGRDRVDARLRRVERAAEPISTGRAAPAFRDGRPDPGEAHAPGVRARLQDTARRLDPDGVFDFHRAERVERGTGGGDRE